MGMFRLGFLGLLAACSAEAMRLQGARDSLVKDGLFVTQPLRSDEQVRVNVIERNPHSHSGGSASGAYLRSKFAADLAALRGSFLRFNDILTSGNAGAPTEVINFAIESGVGSASRSADYQQA